MFKGDVCLDNSGPFVCALAVESLVRVVHIHGLSDNCMNVLLE